MSSIEPSPNPYAAPQAPLSRSISDPRSWAQRIVAEWRRGAWPLVFLLNLVVPVYLGFGLCSDSGRWGCMAAILGLFVLTSWFLSYDQLLRRRMLTGAKFVAVFQLAPIFHWCLGCAALIVVKQLGLLRPDFFDDDFDFLRSIEFWPALVISLLVGSGLLGLAFLFGLWRAPKTEEDQPRFAT